jgi:hypothetical protein
VPGTQAAPIKIITSSCCASMHPSAGLSLWRLWRAYPEQMFLRSKWRYSCQQAKNGSWLLRCRFLTPCPRRL